MFETGGHTCCLWRFLKLHQQRDGDASERAAVSKLSVTCVEVMTARPPSSPFPLHEPAGASSLSSSPLMGLTGSTDIAAARFSLSRAALTQKTPSVTGNAPR